VQPLVPADVDLRGMPFMPLDVNRLRDSQLAIHASGDEFRAAVLLWCASWNQVPAASLPNDDRALAAYAGYARDLKGWKKVREGAMRGFVLCDDGRHYHPVVAEKALEAWDERVEYREEKVNKDDRKKRERAWRQAAFAALRSIGITPEWNEKTHVLRALVKEHELSVDVQSPSDLNRPVTPPVTPVTPPVTVTDACRVTAKTGTGTGTGTIKDQEQELSRRHASQDRHAHDDDVVPSEQDLPSWVPRPIWREFYRHRAVCRKPLSIPSQRQVVQRLTELREQGHDITESLRQTIAAGLAIPVTPKGEQEHAANSRSSRGSAADRVRANAEAGEQRDRDAGNDSTVVRVIG